MSKGYSIVNSFQFTTKDYLAYIQMSNYHHVLVENDEIKRSTDELLKATRRNVPVDDIEHLVHFNPSHRSSEQIGIIFSNAIRSPYAGKLVRLASGRSQSIELVPINDGGSITERAIQSLDNVSSSGIKIQRYPDVYEYLLRHIDLIDLLPFITRIVREGLPSMTTELSLELYRDPEIKDAYLVIFGRSRSYDQEFLDTIKSIRPRYMDLLTGKSGWILVTTDFDSPNERT